MNNNYRIEQVSRSGKNVVIAGLIAAHCLAVPIAVMAEELRSPCRRNKYNTAASSPTFDQYRNIITGEYDQSKDSLEEALSNVYARLINYQEPLGPDFEKVLHDNLWNLYES